MKFNFKKISKMGKVVTTFNVTFFARKEREVNGQLPIYISVNLNKQRLKIASKLSVNENNWDAKKGVPKGSLLAIKQLSMKLADIKSKFFDCFHQLTISKISFTVEDVKNLYFGVDNSKYTLMGMFDYHQNAYVDKIDQSTLTKYITTQNYVKGFLKDVMKKSDIFMSDLNLKFITDFEIFMSNQNKSGFRSNQRNTLTKHIIRIRAIANIALRNEWIDKDPFIKYIVSYNPVNRGFLTATELQVIETTSFDNPLIELVRNLFVFSCYTGLSYIDLMELTNDNINIGIDKEMWINTCRAKTDVQVKLPVLPQAAMIIKKYENSKLMKIENGVFPFLTNSLINAQLKFIAKNCGISKRVTFHLARHTFATTITLTNGVPIETVSKMLGHTSISTTQIYAKVVDSKISNDMMMLRDKLGNKQANPVQIRAVN